jgi:uncharacterized membrane protein (UPF0127 family)
MEQKWILAAGLLVIAAPVLMSLQPSEPAETLGKGSLNATFYSDGQKASWAVLEVADNESERRKGLMNVTELGERRGMLFVFEEEEIRSFWMKNTYIPLDIIFLDSDKTIINIEDARPQPNVSEENLTRYRSDLPAKYVVELREGFAENFSVSEGSRVSW